MPFQKGQSGNPKGRPPVGTSVSQMARDVLEKGSKPKGPAILAKFAEMALEGSAPHANFLFDRAYGKALESMNLSGGLSLYEQGAKEAAGMTKEQLLGALKKLYGSKLKT